MVKSIVIYNSRGGNTKKIASKIAETLEADLVKSNSIPDLNDYKLVVVGTWVLAGNPSPSGKKYLEKLNAEQLKKSKVAMFISAAGPEGPPLGQGPEAGIIKDLVFEKMQKILEDKGINVLKERLATKGTFRFLRFGPGFKEKGFPTEEEIQKAKDFAESIKKYKK